jgi:DNA-binding NtrC family response regulator
MTTDKSDAPSLRASTGIQSVIHSSNRASTAPPPHGVELLLISPFREDLETLKDILSSDCTIIGTASCREALFFLCRGRVPVIVCERDLPDGTWKDLLSHLAEFQEMPALIVTSKFANEELWAEVMDLGGFDVVAKPFSELEVKNAVALAWREVIAPSQHSLAANSTGAD